MEPKEALKFIAKEAAVSEKAGRIGRFDLPPLLPSGANGVKAAVVAVVASLERTLLRPESSYATTRTTQTTLSQSAAVETYSTGEEPIPDYPFNGDTRSLICISPPDQMISAFEATAKYARSTPQHPLTTAAESGNVMHTLQTAAGSLPTKERNKDSFSPERKSQLEHSQPRSQAAATMTHLRDIVGHAAVKLRIDELLLPLGLPDSLVDTVLTGSRSIPATILLHGPPGCGKTKLAEAIAGEAQAAFVSIAPSDVLSKFVGESEASIRAIFCSAVEKALRVPSRCAVIFLDELDALGQSRENMGTGEGEGCSRRVLAELLLHLNVIADRRYCTLEDFAESNTSEHFSSDDYSATESVDSQRSPRDHTARIIVAAATNRIADIDPALLRRFGIQLEVGLPTRKDRQKMITRLLADIPHTLNHEELGVLAYITVDWSGSSLADLTRTAVMRPIHECLRKAAVLRRRSEKLEQRGGDPSGQNDVPQSSDMAATKSLVEGVQNLRAVTIHDFRTAISTLTGSEISFTRSLELSSSKKRSRRLHYDSSSSSEGEE